MVMMIYPQKDADGDGNADENDRQQDIIMYTHQTMMLISEYDDH